MFILVNIGRFLLLFFVLLLFSAVKLLSEQFRNLTRIQKFAKIHKMKHKKKHKNLVRNADSLRISNTNVYTY